MRLQPALAGWPACWRSQLTPSLRLGDRHGPAVPRAPWLPAGAGWSGPSRDRDGPGRPLPESWWPVAESSDTAERIAYAAEFLFRHVLAYQGAVRAMIAATITRPELAHARPGLRFGLIDHALAPLRDTLAVTDPDTFSQLRVDLAVAVSAEALFTLTDLSGLTPEQAIASATRTARTLTTAAIAS